ncbi:site-specific integrase [Phyllobacterium sp. 21LDTY02-6]|uniref:tyrosine-type recombinase/integrase n=1 Tax=Phyllobacterium sp. 21LDTY02-6 TaxID=2944903 RepID=UPI0020207419|nr:site-specific integrase [Phyllobacterium sp. 21LDTY02-6]MCO4317332.1 site-specific integrase [Phyllobacterium sp. 21LDTY02-6]
MSINVNLTKRTRKRTLQDGSLVRQLRYVVNYKCPKTGQRKQEFFERQKDAQARQSALTVSISAGSYVDQRTVPTVNEAVDDWLADRKRHVKESTHTGYSIVVAHIKGPYLVGTQREKAQYTATGVKPRGTHLLPMLGKIKLNELTTADIRGWHRQLQEHSGTYTANRAKSHFKAVLAMAEEDHGVRAPSMPTGLGRGKPRVKKAILTTEQIAKLVEAAKHDKERGIYCVFPFLVGTRPSEQFGLLWEDVDFEANVIRIRRMQERDGSLTAMTKTEAGTREVPMGKTLRTMLLEWRARCPRKGKELYRVFPGPGRVQAWPKPRIGGGGALVYQNFRKRYWVPFFTEQGFPYVTPHSARHSFISTMQAQGIEVGLVARLAGHANATVTLGHYTQAVRGGQVAVDALERAYSGH